MTDKDDSFSHGKEQREEHYVEEEEEREVVDCKKRQILRASIHVEEEDVGEECYHDSDCDDDAWEGRTRREEGDCDDDKGGLLGREDSFDPRGYFHDTWNNVV